MNKNTRFKKGSKVDVEKMPLKQSNKNSKQFEDETRKELDDKTSLYTQSVGGQTRVGDHELKSNFGDRVTQVQQPRNF